MPRCLDCENDHAFFMASISWDKVYFEGEEVYDVKSVESYPLTDPEYATECGDCGSTNVEGV